MADTTLVVGAGIVGLACAVEAQRRGHRVTLIDPLEPGQGCSLGNAGIIAASEIFPLISPGRLLDLPRMLLSRDAPAVLRLAALPQFLPWIVRAAATLSGPRQQAITAALAALNRNAVSAWRNLLTDCGASHLLREQGMIRLIRDPRDQPGLVKVQNALAAYALASRLLDRSELRGLEPLISDGVLGGLLHESDADIGDPLNVSRALLERFRGGGGRFLRETALSLQPRENGAAVITETATHTAAQVWVTMGLQSSRLLAPLGVTVPLQAERGYHLMLPGCGRLLSRPVTFLRESCVATPMGDHLRLAGTVEFDHDSAPPDWSRAEQLAAHAARYFDADLAKASASPWVGSRPSLPDSLPAIGRMAAAPAIGYAFGHQHLGITQAAISARLLCQIMRDEPPEFAFQVYDIARFS
jgi:glycine/D-amino acid oxidase-like deaminating enzyme